MSKFLINKNINLQLQDFKYSLSLMSYVKTPSKQCDNSLPKNLLKNQRVSKEPDKVESDDDNV